MCLCSRSFASDDFNSKTGAESAVASSVIAEKEPSQSPATPSAFTSNLGELIIPDPSVLQRSLSLSPLLSPPMSPGGDGEFYATVGQCNPYPPKDVVVSNSNSPFFPTSYFVKTYGCGGTELAVGMDPHDSANNSLASSREFLVPFNEQGTTSPVVPMIIQPSIQSLQQASPPSQYLKEEDRLKAISTAQQAGTTLVQQNNSGAAQVAIISECSLIGEKINSEKRDPEKLFSEKDK